MLKRYHNTFGGLFRLIDACVIAAVWVVSYGLRFYLPVFHVTKGFPPFATYAALSPLMMILWVAIFSSMGVYQSTRILRRTHEAHLVLKAHLASLLVFISITYLFSEYKYSRGVMVYFGILSGVLLITSRLTLRNTLRAVRRKGFNLRKAIVVGEGAAASVLIDRLDRFPELGLSVMGFVTHETSPTQTLRGKNRLGSYHDLHAVLQKIRPDQIIIALPRSQGEELDRILEIIKDETADIQLVPDIHEYVTLGCEIEDFDGLPIVNLNDSPLAGWGALAKRATDMFLSSVALVFLFPVLLFVAVAIKLSSKGPIFYRQERMGLDGRTFQMLKFRSMKPDAEEKTGPIWAKPGDERRTSLGSLLRATSIDELPQLWNVLKGDMSLVGPRPERPVFVQQFRNDIPHYMLRHKVKAGITGWAQVNGWRGDTSLSKRIECDLFYIRNWSYVLDWKILLLTLWRGFIHRNAY